MLTGMMRLLLRMMMTVTIITNIIGHIGLLRVLLANLRRWDRVLGPNPVSVVAASIGIGGLSRLGHVGSMRIVAVLIDFAHCGFVIIV